MKKIMLTALAVMSFVFANAQEIKFGVKGGVNFANLEQDANGSSLTGFNAGGFAEIKLSEKFTLQPEVLYSTQGSDFSEDGYSDKLKLSYLNVPVMAKFYVIQKLNVEVGPQIGFLLSAKETGENVKEFFKSVDFGLNAGIGYDFTKNIFAGIRYYRGLLNIVHNTDGDDIKAVNSVFSISAGYKF